MSGISLLAAGPARAFDQAAADRALQFARERLTQTTRQMPVTSSPKSSRPDGTWLLVPNTDMVGWTQGFLPGALWYMYQDTGDASWKAKADAWTRSLEVQKCNTQTHDNGFKVFPSFGHAWRLTGTPYDKHVALTAARSLATRYNARVGIINCCGWNPNWHLPLVVDTMMNLELLFWGAQNGGDPAWKDMALNHALRTLSDLVRPDGSTYHVVDYDAATGAILWRGTFQGYTDISTWSRGQAWAVYGYTMAYRYTRDPRMLAAARKVTDYYLSRLPADSIPNWDFDSPTQRKDSSAAAAVASALLELSTFVQGLPEEARYRNAALAMLDSLSSPAYLAAGTTHPGILLHAVGNLPANQEVDVSLIYGDYYFIEALLRFKQRPMPAEAWSSRFVFSLSTHELGSHLTGLQQVDFDVTPLRHPIDSVVGFADTSTSVTAYSRMAMLLRMNPSGVFDVFNGTGYAARVSIPYAANTTYHVRMVTDLAARRYSVWITSPGGTPVLLADRYAFRAEAPLTDDLGQVVTKSGYIDNEFKLERFSLTPAWYSKTNYRTSTQNLGSCNTGRQVAEFDLTPRRSPLDGYVGYADSATDITSRSLLAMYLRLNASGYFDVRNGDVYTARTAVRYSAAVTYRVRMVADLGTRRYSVWITPPGQAPILLAENAAFRTRAPATDDLGKLALSTPSDNEMWVSNHTLVAQAYATSLGASHEAAGSCLEASTTEADTGPEESLPAGEALGCASVPGSGALALGGLLLWLGRAGLRRRTGRRFDA